MPDDAESVGHYYAYLGENSIFHGLQLNFNISDSLTYWKDMKLAITHG
jgi:hypothetical protein